MPYEHDELRALIKAAQGDEPCSPNCRGWDVFETNRGPGLEIQRCDECLYDAPKLITDIDVAALPEAMAELSRVRRAHRFKIFYAMSKRQILKYKREALENRAAGR